MMADMARAPRTLCHGDFRADNLMFMPDECGPALITVDWQAPLQARGAFDVGYLMSMSVTTELRRAHEADLLRRYYDRLVAAGVAGCRLRRSFFHDYRRGLLIGFVAMPLRPPRRISTIRRAEALFDERGAPSGCGPA